MAASRWTFVWEVVVRNSRARSFIMLVALAAATHVIVRGQGSVSQNINVITGTSDQFVGDVFRQRQNEGVLGISSVNPAHMMSAYNDYRTVDFVDPSPDLPPSPQQGTLAKVLDFFHLPRPKPGRPAIKGKGELPMMAAAHAWIGLSFSDNGGKDWYTGLHPGHVSIPAGQGTEGWDESDQLRDVYHFEAASDPVMALTHNEFFVGGIAFNPGGQSVGFVSRFTDRNFTETGQNIQFDGTKIVVAQPAKFFVDKPSIAAAPGAPNGKSYVYAAFVIFDETDPKKLSSKVVVFRSANSGETWSQKPLTISQPLTRNQAPWIVVDPNNPRIVYVGWRVFAAQAGGIANAIVGKKSTDGGATFGPSFPYPVALLLKAFDQPQGNLLGSPPTLPSPRSNAYPTAVIDGTGAIHVALQEYVNPTTGVPISPLASPLTGVPRITVTSSYNGGVLWTPRRAIDFTPGSGTQFVPVLAAVGEPGPSCPGRKGPRSRVMVMYYDARASGVGAARGIGIVAGSDKQFDVRLAEASACNRDGLGRLIFGASQQVSRYALNAAPNANGQHEIVKRAGHGYTSVNRPYPMFCGGGCAFSGDYLHLIPRVPYVRVGTGWRLTTATGVNQNTLPAPVVKGVWADTRDVLLPGADPAVDPAANPPVGNLVPIDTLPWSMYDAPGTGALSCQNPGSRDQNIYSAESTPGGLFAAAPETFRVSNIPRAYPVYVENRSAQLRLFKLTIDAGAQASFDFTTFEPGPTFGQHRRQADIAIGPFSTVTGSVIVGPNVATSILITIAEVNANGALIANGARTSVTLFTAGLAEATSIETHVPVVTTDPIVTKPYPAGTFPFTNTAQTPFTQNPFTQNPFSQNPFSQNPFSQNPFTQNPFTQNPFAQNTTIYDATDVSFQVSNAGTHAAAFSAILNLQKNVQPLSYFFQVLITRTTATPGLTGPNGCQSVDRPQDVQISSILNPFTQNPFTQNPFSQNPFSQNPFSQNPFTQNPFTQNPFSQNTVPEDIEVSNSTFYVAPTGSGAQGLAALSTGDYRASRAVDQVIYTLRMFRMFEIGQGNATVIDPFTDVGVTVKADVPDIDEDGTFEDVANTAGGGAANPVIVTQTLPAATAGAPYSQTVLVNGGVAPYAWSIDLIPDQTLPPGLTLNTQTGVISGTPTTVGLNTFRVRVTDSLNHTDTAVLCINVEPAFVGTLTATPATIDVVAQTLVGSGVAISNLQYTGSAAAIGTFAGAAQIGLNSGIMLSSGNVTNINGPNTIPSAGLDNGTPGDADLNARIPSGQNCIEEPTASTTCDAAVLEFDFVPQGAVVSFQYVFASEEYDEFVNSQFNDVFAFLISGPGILPDPGSDKANFALVPGPVLGSTSPVSINTVNNGPLNNGVGATNPQLYVNNVGGTIQTQADGLTRVLTLQAVVVPGQTYHMKLAVADAGDRFYDSWVLIKANSLVACSIIEEP